MEKLKDLKCEETTFLLRKIIRIISNKIGGSSHYCSKFGNQSFYSIRTNQFLMENCLDTLLSLSEYKWPDEFMYLVISNKETSYSYINSVLSPPFISLPLYFGYAVIDGQLKKTSFFVINDNQVIDPISVMNRVKPEYYFGSTVNKVDLEKYMVTFDDPLESFVNRIKAVKPFSRYSHHASSSDGSEYL